MSASYILTLMGRTRVGVIRDISAIIVKLAGNIETIRQLSLESENYFSVILKATFPASITPEAIQRAFAAALSDEFLPPVVEKYESNSKEATDTEPSEQSDVVQEQFVLTVTGLDAPGVLHDITECLAAEGIDIINLWGERKEGNIDLVVQTNVPGRSNASAINRKLQSLHTEGLLIHFQHREIVDATEHILSRGPLSSRSEGQ